MRHKMFALILCLVSPVAAQADCVAPSETFLSCTIRNGTKTLDVCVSGATVTYRFGPTGRTPDLVLPRSAANVHYEPWPGIGRTIWENVTFKNGDVSYRVFGAIDKVLAVEAPSKATTGGVEVLQNTKTLARLTCDPKSVEFSYADALTDAKKAAGQCWNTQERIWGRC